jgi:serine/threonine protein phosphatase PrpC
VTLFARHAAVSHVGRQRPGNEDAHLVRPPLYAVADGMGGARAGEVASEMAVTALAELLTQPPADDDEAAALLAAAAAEANSRIYAAASEDRTRSGMGTTLTALLLRGDHALLAHIGDSRAYLLRGDELTQLTQDHSLVAEMVREGRLAPDEARQHPYRSVLSRALGTEPDAEVDELRVDLMAGDVLLLCSDGLSGPVPPDKLRKGLAAGDPDKAARRLVDEALRHGGPDNITAVVLQLSDGAADSGADAAETLVMPAGGTDLGGPDEPAGAAGERTSAVGDTPSHRRRWLWMRRGREGRTAVPAENG